MTRPVGSPKAWLLTALAVAVACSSPTHSAADSNATPATTERSQTAAPSSRPAQHTPGEVAVMPKSSAPTAPDQAPRASAPGRPAAVEPAVANAHPRGAVSIAANNPARADGSAETTTGKTAARTDTSNQVAAKQRARNNTPAPPVTMKKPARSDAPAATDRPRARELPPDPTPAPPADTIARRDGPAVPLEQPAQAREASPSARKTAPAPEPESPRTRVVIPETAHVHASVPPALQALLDDDPRMQPWLNRFIAVADRCYTSSSDRGVASAGTIEADIAMHENARPSYQLGSVPGQLRAVVTCATFDLMRDRMPLFTSHEGERYHIALRFE